MTGSGRHRRRERRWLLALGLPALLALAQQQWLLRRPPRLLPLEAAAASAGPAARTSTRFGALPVITNPAVSTFAAASVVPRAERFDNRSARAAAPSASQPPRITSPSFRGIIPAPISEPAPKLNLQIAAPASPAIGPWDRPTTPPSRPRQR